MKSECTLAADSRIILVIEECWLLLQSIGKDRHCQRDINLSEMEEVSFYDWKLGIIFQNSEHKSRLNKSYTLKAGVNLKYKEVGRDEEPEEILFLGI